MVSRKKFKSKLHVHLHLLLILDFYFLNLNIASKQKHIIKLGLNLAIFMENKIKSKTNFFFDVLQI